MSSPPAQDPFANVRKHLSEMQQLTSATQVDLVALGKCYAGLAQAMLAAIERVGQSSMRFTAVQKALDLRTTKSALQRFLDEP